MVSVLHIWNTAGVASVIAKFQKKILGWNTWVIMRGKYDKYGLTTYGEIINTDKIRFILKALVLARKYDIIHVHDLDRLIPVLKTIYNKKIILHYHGSRIRGRWSERKKYWGKADLVLVSTPDLLENAPNDIIYLPNPVDTQLFKPMLRFRKRNTALYIYRHQLNEDIEWPKKIAEKMGWDLTIIDREKNPIPYREMPQILNRYEYFIDRKHIPSLSKTALEALACGVKVVRWDEKIVSELPIEHSPKYVVFKLKELYDID